MVGAPHPDLGETVVALAVRERGAKIDTDALTASLRETLADYKQPRLIEIIDELPRNTLAKVQKAELRQRYRAAFA